MSEFTDSHVLSDGNDKIPRRKKRVQFAPDTLPGMLHLVLTHVFIVTNALLLYHRVSSKNSAEYNQTREY